MWPVNSTTNTDRLGASQLIKINTVNNLVIQGHCVVPYRTAHFDLLETVKGHNVFESFEQQS